MTTNIPPVLFKAAMFSEVTFLPFFIVLQILCLLSAVTRRQAECAKTARIQMALPTGKPGAGTANNLYEELGDNAM